MIPTIEKIETSINDVFGVLDEIKNQEKRIINVLLDYIRLKINEGGYVLPIKLGWKKQTIDTIINMETKSCYPEHVKYNIYFLASALNIHEMMKINN